MQKSTLRLVRDLGRKLSNAADYDSAYLTWKETGGDMRGLKLRYSDAIRTYREAEALMREIIARTPHHYTLSVKAQTELVEYWYVRTENTEKMGYDADKAYDTTLVHYRKLLMMLGEELMYALRIIQEGGVECK